jgi:hypothetical protein
MAAEGRGMNAPLARVKSSRVRIVGPRQREFAKQLIDAADIGDVVRIGAETRSEEQNRKMWPMLADLRNQVDWLGEYTTEDIKLMFLNRLGVELRFLPTLERQGMFPVGLRSSTLTKEQFSALIELLYQFGAEHDVRWTDPVERKAA